MIGSGWGSEFGSGPGFGSGPDFMFRVFPILFFLVFLFIFGMIIYSIYISARNNSRNNRSPVLTVEAKVIAKRSDISHHHHSDMNDNMNSMNHTHTSTRYYVTFQVESGDRMELQVTGTESGMLLEGDQGKLTFQGTRYLRFDRV